jgi:hypothetical protein
MALLDDLNKDLSARPNHKCAVLYVLEQVESEEYAKLNELVHNLEVNASRLARILVKNGFDIKSASITRHRRKDCACDVKQ